MLDDQRFYFSIGQRSQSTGIVAEDFISGGCIAELIVGTPHDLLQNG